MMYSSPFSLDKIDALNAEYETKSVSQRLEFALEHLDPMAMAISFQNTETVIFDMALKIKPDLELFYIDTGYHFPESIEIKERLEAHYKIKITELRPSVSMEQQAVEHGENLYERDTTLCCNIRKVQPLQEKLATLSGWITGLRRDQSEFRKDTPIFEVNEKADGSSLVKVSPLADWANKEVWDYMMKNNLPYHLLYDKDYASIGCAPCTRPVGADDDERAGRWAGENKTECGIHTFMEKKN